MALETKSATKRALFSIFEPVHGVELAATLSSLGWEIVATSETATVLNLAGIPAVDIYDFLKISGRFQVPPTLHPKIEIALAGNPDNSGAIDLLYDETYDRSIGLDVGGHTLIALAVKGNRIVCTSRDDASLINSEFRSGNGLSDKLSGILRIKALSKLAAFYNGINELEMPRIELANGENPYQSPAYLIAENLDDPFSLSAYANLSATTPCYTNMADLDSIANSMIALSRAFSVNLGSVPFLAMAAKHGNACGIGISWNNPAEAIELALWGSPLAIWGGEFVVNFIINRDCATLLVSSQRRMDKCGHPNWMLDLIAAPGYEKTAVGLLLERPFRKIFTNLSLAHPEKGLFFNEKKQVRGGLLTQPPHCYILELPLDLKNDRDIAADLLIAWCVSFWSFHGGNEVAITKSGQLLSCAGGPSTIDAVKTTILRAVGNGHELKGSSFAADAFFPFTDAPLALIEAGCIRGTAPRGGIRFQEVSGLFKQRGVRCHFLDEDIRGFIKH